MSKEWKCADCCVFETEGCHYPSMEAHYIACEHLCVDHEKAYKQGKEDAIDEFIDNVSESIIWDVLAEVMKRNIGSSEGADRIIEYLQKVAEQLKENNNDRKHRSI